MVPVIMSRQPKYRALDWACASMVLAWGVILAMPGTTLAWSPAFEPLLDRFPEGTWAAGLILLALVRIAALIINGHMPTGSPIARGSAAALSAVVWSQFLIGALDVSLRAHIVLPGVGINLVLLACEIVTVTRSTCDFLRARQRSDPG